MTTCTAAAPKLSSPPRRTGRPSSRGTVRALRARLPFDRLGERLVTVTYETHGSPAAPATVVLGGISASRHLAPTASDPSRGWWRGVVGPTGAISPARRFLVGLDYLGGETSAGLLRPVTTHDQARATAAVLDELGVHAADLVGASYGGMVAMAFAELFPHRVARMVVVCGAHRTHPMATAVRSVQRAAAELGRDSGRESQGLALARALAMTTYRSPQEFDQRFSSAATTAGAPASKGRVGAAATAALPAANAAGPATVRFPVQDYIEARGDAFARQFDLDRFLALSESIDLHSTDPRSLPANALLVSFDTDSLVPTWLVAELAERSGRQPRHVVVPSLYGHDAFLKEVNQMKDLLAPDALPEPRSNQEETR